LAGVALLVVAAFAPFLLLRLVGVLEVAVAAGALEGTRQRGARPLLYGGQMAFYALQRHRLHGARPGGITVAGAGGLGPAAGLTVAGGASTAVWHAADVATRTLPQQPPPPPPRGRPPDPRRDRPDDPPHAKGA